MAEEGRVLNAATKCVLHKSSGCTASDCPCGHAGSTRCLEGFVCSAEEGAEREAARGTQSSSARKKRRREGGRDAERPSSS